jgi:hypothetical protein
MFDGLALIDIEFFKVRGAHDNAPVRMSNFLNVIGVG